MSFANSIKFGAVAVAVALAAQVATAGPPPHAHPGGAHPGARVGPAPLPHYHPAPYYSGYRGGVSIGIGYGSGLYGPLGYGLGYSPFGYSGLPYGGVGYGALGYGYGYPATRTISSVGVPIISGTSLPPYQYIPAQPSAPAPLVGDPAPLPLPAPGNGGKGEPATITVITSEGATVSFDDIASEQTGTRHSFTTKPIGAGVQTRVIVKVTGPGGPSSVSISIRAGEKATVDMRN